MTTTDPAHRTAPAPEQHHAGPITLINGFVVPQGRESAFAALWAETSQYFRDKPGFVSLRMHRSLSAEAQYRFINVAEWASAQQFAAAHATAQFRALVSRPEWKEFPSQPALYEIHAEFRVPAVIAARATASAGTGSV